MQGLDFGHIRLLLIAAFLFGCCSSLEIGETCSNTSSGNCNDGLACGTCVASGNTRPRCVRVKPIIPTTKVKGLPFNHYSWLTTHNSFARTGSTSATGSPLLTQMNQEDSVSDQLKNGVRGLMLDMYDFNNDVWLCHSFEGKCYNITAFQPAINVLKEIHDFLEGNPTEIVTIFIEDYVSSPNGLSKVFNASGLNQCWFPLTQMPKNGEDWPTVDDMVAKNQRLVVFTSKKSKEASEGIAYEWDYVVENQYGNHGMSSGPCRSRSESRHMDATSRSLVLMNYFPSNPNITEACVHNSAPLINMMKTCHSVDGKRWPNFIAVDFYKMSDGGGAQEAVDEANGLLTCNCSSIAYCKENGGRLTCNVPVLSPPPPAGLSPTTVTTQEPGNNSVVIRPLLAHWFIILTMMLNFVVRS